MEGLRTRDKRAAHSRVAGERPRTPGIAYAVVTVISALLVGAMALTSRQAAPPTIAEFAPQAAGQIADASADPVRGFARTAADAALDEASGGSDQPSGTIDVARVRQCVGDPPRQAEDPQSPPCVPYWSGDNGGATWRGVTRDEIRISDPVHVPQRSTALAAFFNRRFEFYGRQIRLIPRNFSAGDPSAGRAAARAAYEQDQAFASTGVGYKGQVYFEELARLGILGAHYAPVFPESYLAQRRPFLWAYPMGNDRMFASVGAWFCARFAGRNASHAGDPVLQASRRKPGIILTDAGREGTSLEPMNDHLSSCGERTEALIQTEVQAYDLAYYAAFMENAMLQMKTWGVTTVACLCVVDYFGLAMRAATHQGYFPEWLITDYVQNWMAIMRIYAQSPEQLKSLMVLLVTPMERAYSDHPSNWAMQESIAGYRPSDPIDQQLLNEAYRPLLLLAAGVQLAGPNLTPETFERGMHRARFPNPAHRIMAGAVGFGDGDHTMTDDAAEIWWSNTARSPYPEDPPGAFCYVEHGARRRIGTFPNDDPFFTGPCDTGRS